MCICHLITFHSTLMVVFIHGFAAHMYNRICTFPRKVALLNIDITTLCNIHNSMMQIIAFGLKSLAKTQIDTVVPNSLVHSQLACTGAQLRKLLIGQCLAVKL